ncbi:MAG: hypothetical protein IPM64_09185 [Phycisphaerales bacterium]|nr:hypothetical protein [Phycisphaerales bacterium]
MPRDVISRTADPALAALRIAGRDWPRALLSPILVPDAWLGLVDTRDGRRRRVVAGDDPRPAADDTLTLLRSRPLATPIEVGFRPDADGAGVAAVVELLIRVLPGEHELAAFARLIPDGGEMPLSRIAELVTHAGAAKAVSEFIRSERAEALVASDVRSQLQTRLADALSTFLFDSGMELVGITRAHFRAASAPMPMAPVVARPVSATAAATAGPVGQSVAQGVGNVRGDGRSAAGRSLSSAIAEVLVLDARRITRFGADGRILADSAFELPTDLGPLRSLSVMESPPCAVRRLLAVGARLGVWLLDPASGRQLARLDAGKSPSTTTGFNRCALRGDWLLATHSQLGVWTWNLRDPRVPGRCAFPPDGRPLRAPRALPGERMLFAHGRELIEMDAHGRTRSRFDAATADVHDIAVCEGAVHVADDAGRVLAERLDGRQGAWEQLYRSAAGVESIAAGRRDGRLEIIVADRQHGVVGLYPELRESAVLMPLVTGARRAWACGDALAALSELRDHVSIGLLGGGGSVHELRPSAGVAGGIQDVALLPLELAV